MQHIAIIGASLAGARAAQAIRSAGFEGQVTLIGEEAELPYDRPPLSKQYLQGEWESDDIRLITEEDVRRLNLNLCLDCQAQGLDPRARRLQTNKGEVGYDGLVVATGARPRTFPGASGKRIHALRTRADAARLREQIRPGSTLGVLGGGLLGSEVASTAVSLGAKVTIFERDPSPMSAVLGDIVGRELAGWHRTHGVDLRLSTTIVAVGELPDRVEVEYTGGTLTFDHVLVAIGAVPNTEWLDGSGLAVDDGVVCDETLFAFEDSVVVAGDVARVRNARGNLEKRIEHWTNAAGQGETAANNLLAGRSRAVAVRAVPYIWSDQFGSRIEILGSPMPDDEVESIWTSVGGGSQLFLYRREREATALVGFNAGRWMVGVRRHLRREKSITRAVVADLEMSLRSAS